MLAFACSCIFSAKTKTIYESNWFVSALHNHVIFLLARQRNLLECLIENLRLIKLSHSLDYNLKRKIRTRKMTTFLFISIAKGKSTIYDKLDLNGLMLLE